MRVNFDGAIRAKDTPDKTPRDHIYERQWRWRGVHDSLRKCRGPLKHHRLDPKQVHKDIRKGL